jgi:hypothetical protein
VGGEIFVMFERMKNIQNRMRIQIVYNESRLKYLKHFWKHQRDVYGLFLKNSKKEKERELYGFIDSYDKDVNSKMLRLYIERCKMIHALAFF